MLGSIGGYTGSWDADGANTTTIAIGGTGLLFLPPLLMIVFREKYPRWWYDWNRELLRFENRVGTYFALMNDHYPRPTSSSVHSTSPIPTPRPASTDGCRSSSGSWPSPTTSCWPSSTSGSSSR